MLTLNRNIRKSFGSSSECLWNVMQKWQADLWHSSISRKENEPAVNILWPLVHYYVFLVVSIISHLFPPYTPWCAPFYHGNIPIVNFIFLAFFLPAYYWQHISQGSKIICWVAWRHPSIAINRILPLKTPRNIAKSKDYWVAQKYSRLRAVFRQNGTLSRDVSY